MTGGERVCLYKIHALFLCFLEVLPSDSSVVNELQRSKFFSMYYVGKTPVKAIMTCHNDSTDLPCRCFHFIVAQVRKNLNRYPNKGSIIARKCIWSGRSGVSKKAGDCFSEGCDLGRLNIMHAVFQAAFLPCNCCIPLVFISTDQALQWGALQRIHHLVSKRSLKLIECKSVQSACRKCCILSELHGFLTLPTI